MLWVARRGRPRAPRLLPTRSSSTCRPSAQGGYNPATFALSLFGASANRFLNLEISALEADGKGKVVSSPRVITADQVKALIEQGTELPYQTATSSGATALQFRKANLKLEVTPQITPEGNVILDVDVNKDSVGQSTAAGFAIDTKHVKTQVLVENGGTVVIGGIFEQNDRTDVTKVPFLGDMPVPGQPVQDHHQVVAEDRTADLPHAQGRDRTHCRAVIGAVTQPIARERVRVMKLVKAIWILLCRGVAGGLRRQQWCAAMSPFNRRSAVRAARRHRGGPDHRLERDARCENTGSDHCCHHRDGHRCLSAIRWQTFRLTISRSTTTPLALPVQTTTGPMATAVGRRVAIGGEPFQPRHHGDRRTAARPDEVRRPFASRSARSSAARPGACGDRAVGSTGNVQYRVVDQAWQSGWPNQADADCRCRARPCGTADRHDRRQRRLRLHAIPRRPRPASFNDQRAQRRRQRMIHDRVGADAPARCPTVTVDNHVGVACRANPSVVGDQSRRRTTQPLRDPRAVRRRRTTLPITNVRVRFDLDGDRRTRSAASFTTGSGATLYSDANGVVTTAYVPGTARARPTA